MKINNHQINYSEEKLAEMLEKQTIDIELAGPELEGYKKLFI